MKIYLSHSSSYDYENELYSPLKQSQLSQQNEILFPHDKENVHVHSKQSIVRADLILAEVSYPSTGQGIELGWANDEDKPIICIYKKGMKISSGLHFITNVFIEYQDQEDMLSKLAVELIKSD